MKIHGICVVKNEGDIFRAFLRESARWCDHIYVYDNGSADDTWNIAQEMARTLPQVVPFQQNDRPFDDVLRADIFNRFRDAAKEGDWWCRLDADEFYIDDPRAFLAKVPRCFHVVWAAHLQFYLTEEDVRRLPETADGAPPELSLLDLPRHYRADASEGRFFRHRAGLRWPAGAWPRHVGLAAPQRIRVKHYQYRSPAQVQRRLDTRHEAAARGGQVFLHNAPTDWREKLVDGNGLAVDRGDGVYEIDPARLPRHLESWWTRLAKRCLHGAGVWP